MSRAAFPEGVHKWSIKVWENCHQNFKHKFKADCSYKLTLPESLSSSADKYQATTENFMWLIKVASNNNFRLRAMGNGWSFSEVAVCDGGAVDTKSLRLSFSLKDSFVSQDYLNSGKKSSDLFFVQCGMSVLQLNEKLEAAGRSLIASGASNGQSIAGCTSTGTHGSAFNIGAVHDTIIGLHVIVGPDRHVWLEKKSNPVASNEFISWLGAEKISNDDVFNSAVVSFGNFGFIHGVLLETAPIFLLEEHKSGKVNYDLDLINTLNTLNFSSIQHLLPYPQGTPNKELYHFEVLMNPHQFESGNPEKGPFLKTMYKIPYTPNYTKRTRDSSGFQYGDDTLGLVQTILDAVGRNISSAVIPPLVNAMLPLVFKPAPAAFGTIGETFNNTKFRGKAASAAIGFDASQVSKVLEEIIAINKQTAFAGAVACRYVKGTKALMGFTKFPLTCILELDGVESRSSRNFFDKVWSQLEELNIPYTLHWGKINFNLTPERVQNMYGNNVDKWKNCRNQLLNSTTRKVFTNEFMERCGLDD